MVYLGLKPRVADWKTQTNPLSYGGTPDHDNCVFFLKNGPTLASFSFIFGLFKQTSLQFLQQIYEKKCPSSIRCRDSNPQHSVCESAPITTRPGLPPMIPPIMIIVSPIFFAQSPIVVGKSCWFSINYLSYERAS